MQKEVASEKELRLFGEQLGALLCGGESLELIGDVGAGKTTLTKAIASGMGITETVSSPSYTLSQVYEGHNNMKLVHYDFYRLNDPGILAHELEEVLADARSVVVVEWAGIVADVLPVDHISITIVPLSDVARRLEVRAGGEKSHRLLEQLT